MNLRSAITGIVLSSLVLSNGGALQAATVYDFGSGAGIDRFAFGVSVAEIPIPPTANGVPSTPFSAADYTAVAASDDARYGTGIIEGGIVAATRFVFTVSEPPPSVTQIDVLWEGGASGGETHSVWLWNAVTGSYALVGSQNAAVPPDGLVTGSYTSNPSDFIDAAGAITVLVTYNVQGGAVLTDYVSVTVTGPQCFSDADCDDGLICNGIETCVGGVCQPGTPPDCSDGVPCTIDLCNEATGLCDHVPDDAACDNGVFCDGIETCDPLSGCQPGTPVDCDDGLACTTDSCNEGARACDHIPNAPGCLTPSRWYVDADAMGAGDGTSWASAFNALQDAFAAAVYDDEIWVAAGTYKPDEGVMQTLGDMAAAFWLRNGVAVYGHFLGTEVAFADRDITDLTDPLRRTTLSGDIGTIGIITDNSTHVVVASAVDDSTLLDAFTVRDGLAFDVIGGRGGGMHIVTGSPTISNCTITANNAGALGGGVYNAIGTPTFINCVFSGNSSDLGGGMLNHWGSPVLIDCTFTANQADEKGGGMIELFGNSTLMNCTFRNNFTVAFNSLGGGMYVHQFGGSFGSTTLTNCLFSGNSSNHGGGMMAFGAATLANCTFSQNNATLDSGGFGSAFLTPSLTNCLLWGNTSPGTLERQQIFGLPVSVDYSCVEGWTGTLGGVGNIGADPLFVNPVAGDYHLSAGSPSIDAGDSAAVPVGIMTDLDGNIRFFDEPATPDSGNGGPPVVDMGTYEFGAGVPVIGDVDCDGIVNMSDAQALVDVLLGTDIHPCHVAAADMNGDGLMDGNDIQDLVSILIGA
ncbi:MAG: dockerin type I domain-containing protein [Phycisphaerae bacterium]